jgi:uncharacterized protein
MKLSVVVKANSKVEKVERVDQKTVKVWVHAPPVEGKANEAVITILAKEFGVAKSKVTILKGDKGKNKVVEIDA